MTGIQGMPLTAPPLLLCPAAGLFSWRKDMLLTKATQARSWGWQLFGFLQHDSWGRPAFIHRTINKYTIDAEPWAIELITAPMPSRWARADSFCEETFGVVSFTSSSPQAHPGQTAEC